MKKNVLLVAFVLVGCIGLYGQLPAPYGLTASQVGDDSVQLEWLAPVLPFDGFEDFEDGLMPPDFSVFNINNDNTWGILAGGYNSDYCAACLYDDPVNDDWFVSPGLSVTATSEFNFMAGNYIASYSQEEFEVYISITGPDPSNFPATPELYYQFEADSVYWEPFNIDLSTYAGQDVWLAIRCISPYMWYLLIDDYSVTNMADGSDFAIGFETQFTQTVRYRQLKPGESREEYINSKYSQIVSNSSYATENTNRDLLGYNVYRDNVMVNATTITETSYLDAGLVAGLYEYYVTAVYDEGESIPSETVSIELLPIGNCDEGFESGDFMQFPWIMQGDLPWTISTDLPFNGIYCAKSGAITDNQESILSITLDITAAGDLSFAHRVSTEADWDFLEFYIDDTMEDQWSGITDWSFPGSNIYSIDVGTHTFKWRFMKDTSAAGGEDCVWIDHISFPAFTPAGSLEGVVTNPSAEPL